MNEIEGEELFPMWITDWFGILEWILLLCIWEPNTEAIRKLRKVETRKWQIETGREEEEEEEKNLS